MWWDFCVIIGDIDLDYVVMVFVGVDGDLWCGGIVIFVGV